MGKLVSGTKPPQTEDQGITFIRNLAKKNSIGEDETILFSNHALRRMSNRCIEHDEVIECLINGYFIEFYDEHESHGRYPRVVFYDGHETEIYTVNSFEVPDNMTSTVITSCNVDWDKWKKKDDFIERK